MHQPSPILFALWAHPAMLVWLAAAAAPLVIHLLNKRRYREVPWAAMEYLLAAIRKNSRRILVEQWVLLAVRTAAIVLLVLAVAEPVLESAGLVSRIGQPTHKVLVLDGSYSMAYKPGDKSRFDRAKELAKQIVDESRQGDGFSLVLMAEPPQAVVAAPSFDPRVFAEEVDNLRLPHGGGNLPATIAKIDEMLHAARREHPRLAREEVYFLTDLGRTSWAPELQGDALEDFRQRSKQLGEATSLTVVDLGQPGSENVAIVAAAPVDPLTVVGRETIVEAVVRNFGRQPRPRQLVELFVDGRRAGEAFVDLEPLGRKTLGMPYRFDAPGEHAVEVRLAADLLDVDNHRWLSLPVKERIRVLCVDGRSALGGAKGATDYLAVALAPQEGARRNLVDVQVIPESALLDTPLAGFDCVFLCNIAQFTAGEAQVLHNYVTGGGGLVFFLGDRVLSDAYNRRLTEQSPEGLHVLPALLGERVAEPRYGLDPLGYAHPLVSAFRDQEQAGLLTTPVHEHVRLKLPPASAAKVALAIDSGDPLIVEEPIGKGRSILVSTSADVTWTAMPVWPSFVPIVQELLLLAVRDPALERNVLVGQPLGATVARSAPGNLKLRTPTDAVSQLRVAADGRERRWAFAETASSGFYVAESALEGGASDTFAVNVDTIESDLTPLDASELASEVWPGVSFYHSTSWQNLAEEPTTEIVRRSHLHRWLLIAALATLVAETLLARFFGRHAA